MTREALVLQWPALSGPEIRALLVLSAEAPPALPVPAQTAPGTLPGLLLGPAKFTGPRLTPHAWRV